MITVTAAQQAAIDAKRYKCFARFTLSNSSTLTIGEDEIWEGGFNIDYSVSGQSAFEFGACVINQLTLKIYNPAGQYENTDFLGKRVYAYIELYDEDMTTVIGSISKGYFTVTKADTNGQMVKLTCLDDMRLLDRPYSDVSTAYPATLFQIVTGITSLCGLSLSINSSTWLPTGITSNYTVAVRPEEDLTCRDMLSAVCQATGNYATASNGYMRVTRYDTAFISETGSDYSGYDYHDIDTTSLYKFSRDEAQVTLTGVSVEVGSDVYSAGTDGYRVYIKDNPVINAGSEQTFANALNTLVNGWNFRPFEADHLSNMLMEAGDNIVLTDTLGNSYKSVITHTEFDAGNHQTTECNAEPAEVNASTRYSPAARAAATEIKTYDATVNSYIDMVSNAYGMYRSLITDPNDASSQIYAFHNASTMANSTFCMFENALGIRVGRRDATTDPWVYSSAQASDAVALVQLLTADTAIINQLFSQDITVGGALHSDDYVAASPGASPPYAQAGMGLDFGEKEFEGENFAIDANGKLYANGAEFSGAQITGGSIELTDDGTSINPNLRIYKQNSDDYGTTIGSTYWSKEWYDPNDAAHWYYYAWDFSNGKMIGHVADDVMRMRLDWQNGTIEAVGNITSDYGDIYSGGTIEAEGDVTAYESNFVSKDSRLTSLTTPSSNIYGKAIAFADSTGTHNSYVRPFALTSGVQGIQVETRAYIGGAWKYNTINLCINQSTGAKTIGLSDGAAWRNALGLGNTTGALPIANGGTGATDRLTAFKNLTNQNVGTNATHFVTLTTSWATAGYSTVANVKTVLGMKCTQLYSGTFKSGSTTFSLNYEFFIIYGSSGGNARESVVIPKATIGTSDTTVLISDDESWLSVNLKYSGTTVTMTFKENKATGGTTLTSGFINRVYGVLAS